MEKKKRIIFLIIGIALVIVIACIAGYYIQQNKANEAARSEGKKYAEEYLAKYIIHCGDNIYVSGTSKTLFNGKILSTDNLIQVESIDVLASPSNDSLTAEERNEGIDWKGRIFIINGKNRKYFFDGKRWEDWDDYPSTVDRILGSSLYRLNGMWVKESISNFEKDMTRGGFISYGVAPKPIACSDIPK